MLPSFISLLILSFLRFWTLFARQPRASLKSTCPRRLLRVALDFYVDC